MSEALCTGSACKDQSNLLEKNHEKSSIKKVIGIVSGKGGVGKSLVTSMLAVEMNRKHHNVAILDADVTGPSIPKVFGVKAEIMGEAAGKGFYPAKSKTDIQMMSINLLLENDTKPVIWRGPIIANTVKQFWTDVIWEDVDYMFIDMPPGTGDVPLTVFQSIKVDAIIIVTAPQDLVSMIVSKAVEMAKKMNVPILGLVENMAYFNCDDCGKKHYIYGISHIEEIAQKYNLSVLGKLPIDPKLASLCDNGEIENLAKNLKILPADQWRLRGTFEHMNRLIIGKGKYDNNNKPAVINLADNNFDKYIEGIDATDGSKTQNYGNYGLLYRVYIPTNGQGSINYYLQPRGGVYAGALKIEQNYSKNILKLTPSKQTCFGDKDMLDMEWLGEYVVGEPLSFYFMPPGASNLPVALALVPKKS